MNKELAFSDTTGKQIGHWQVQTYFGDIVRAPIPMWQHLSNFAREHVLPRSIASRMPRYDGEVLNELLDSTEGYNLVVTVGKQMIMDRLFGLSGVGAMSRIGVGTSATAAAIGNTTLTGSAFKAYDATPTRSGLTVTCKTTFGTGDAILNWQELGMDNGTTLLNRIAPIGPFNKTAAVSIIVTVTFTQA